MKSSNKKLKFASYIHNKKFGNYYLPARFQYVILRDYFAKKKMEFTLPQGEVIFTNKSIRLIDIIDKLDEKANLVLLSIYLIPDENKLRVKIFEKLLKKKIKTHFIFENLIARNGKEYSNISNLIKLKKIIYK